MRHKSDWMIEMTVKHRVEAEKQISVCEAKHGFPGLIAEVEKGGRFVVTKNNKPVARIAPVVDNEQAQTPRRQSAVARLLRIMNDGRTSQDGWTYAGERDALHGRGV